MFSMLAFLCITILPSAQVLAANSLSEKTENSEVTDLFVEFIDLMFEHEDNILVTDIFGSNVTQWFKEDANIMLQQDDYQSIHELVIQNNWIIGYSETENLTKKNDFSVMNDIRSRSVSYNFYGYGTNSTTTNSFPKEWVVTLSGTFSYNINTYRITSAPEPNLTIRTANWGASFSPFLENVSTSSSISGSTVNHSASYKMGGTLALPIGSIPIGHPLDYGRHHHTITHGIN
ncbi:hypothetical protein [Amphibacillus jilinensis]|uniref:hypothetical protein n=1 Tax=Amphibacillus jilinensis TaxID=1216008 RepID=UPI001181923A|nr:hypothetical protein [Amphibacillus jilinensis]